MYRNGRQSYHRSRANTQTLLTLIGFGTSLDLDVSGSLECAGRLVNQSPEASVSSLVIPAMLLAIARGTGTLVLDFLLCISAD